MTAWSEYDTRVHRSVLGYTLLKASQKILEA
jgi:hypothetical protein